MVKKPGKPHPSSPFHVICPFCDVPTDRITALSWCGNCGVEWYENRNGGITFDDKRKTPRFAYGKAIQQAQRNQE